MVDYSAYHWAKKAQYWAESIGSALVYRGSVATYADLPSSDQKIGDMYNVLADGANYAWDGTSWDALSGIVDLSAYRTSSDQDLIDAGKQPTLTTGTGINISSANVISVTSPTLTNVSTGSNSLSVLGAATVDSSATSIGVDSTSGTNGTSLGRSANSVNGGLAIGTNSKASGSWSTAIGNGNSLSNTAEATASGAIAIGHNAHATASNAIQIFEGTNSTTDSLQVKTYELLDTSTGLIPDARVSSNIARTSDIPTINTTNNYVPYRSSASAFGNSTLMYNANAMAFTGRLHIGSSSPASYYSKGRLTVYDNTPSQQVSSIALLNYGGGGGCGVAIDMYNTSANGGIPSGRFGLIDNGNYSGYLQLQVKKSGAASNPLLTAMNIVPVPATSSLTTCVSFGKDEFNNVLFDLHKPEATLTTTDATCNYSGSGTTYYVSGTNKFSPRLMVAVGDIVSFDNFSTEAVVIGVVSNSTTCQITTNVSLGTISSKQIYIKKAYFKVTDESNNVKVYIDPYGKFGIGTGTPSYDLDVNGTINASNILQNGQSLYSLPSQTGHSGEFLTTDGTNASWGSIGLSSKMDTDMSNMNASSTAKETIVGWGMPDYSSGVSMTSPYTTPCDGYLFIQTFNGTQRWETTINSQVHYYTAVGSSTITCATWNIINKGVTVTKNNSGHDDVAIFYPLKGTQNA